MGNSLQAELEGESVDAAVSTAGVSTTRHKNVPTGGANSSSGRRHKQHVHLVPLSGSPKSFLNSPLSTPPGAERGANAVSNNISLNSGLSIAVDEMSEEEQVKIAQRIGLIHHLPKSVWDESQVGHKKVRECCICMLDFEHEETIRYLPCMHYYHVACIDDWLLRSFTCPTCMEPVDAALLASYDHDTSDS